MAYFKIGDVDFSHCVSSLKITRSNNYNAQTNAAGDTVVDYINRKRGIEVGIIALDDAALQDLMEAIEYFNVSISYRDPQTGTLAENVNCILPSDEIEYYTIQSNKVSFKAFTLKFTEL